MESKKYQVFISSTYTDLKETRKTVSDTILKMYHFPVGMELFSAGDASQWETITKIIDKTDYYILVLGHRYGSLGANDIGYTEMEYDYAKSKGIPILAFIQNSNVATKPTERESDPKFVEKLEKFRVKATANKICDFWEKEDDLASKVSMALYKSFTNNPRIGWIRGDQGASPEVANLLAQLTVENRKLNEELKKYNTEKRMPKFDLAFNDEKTISLKLEDFEKETYPIPIYSNEIPKYLNEYVDQDELMEYNDTIENSREDIETCLKKLNYNRNIKKNLSQLEVSVKNIGTSKANNVFIDIEFPTEVLIKKNDSIEKLEVTLPKNPLEKAEQKRNKVLKSMTERLQDSFLNMQSSNLDDFPFIDNSPRTSWINFENNKVSIEIESLIHTRKRVLEDLPISIVPLEKGESLVKVSIFCEEMNKKEEFDIPIIVE